MSTTDVVVVTEVCPTSTPWGRADNVEMICEGIWVVDTPSHGGIYVAPELWKTMPPEARETPYSQGGWFEEDCDMPIPLMFFKERILKARMHDWACENLVNGSVVRWLENSHSELLELLTGR